MLVEIPRDRWGRPLIIPPDGGDPVAYTRASTLSKVTDDTSNLVTWAQRHVAVGFARRPDLIDRVIGIISNNDNPVDDAKWDLNKLCKKAQEASGSGSAAEVGTALHEMCEAMDRGRDVVPGRWEAHLDVYRMMTNGLRMLDIETFVVNDELKVAGTFDRLVQYSDGTVMVADLKTGKWEMDYPANVATQIAIYARGSRYDPATGERTPLHDQVDTSTGLLIHLPVTAPRPACVVQGLDLNAGWARAELSVRLREERAHKADHFLRSSA